MDFPTKIVKDDLDEPQKPIVHLNPQQLSPYKAIPRTIRIEHEQNKGTIIDFLLLRKKLQ